MSERTPPGGAAGQPGGEPEGAARRRARREAVPATEAANRALGEPAPAARLPGRGAADGGQDAGDRELFLLRLRHREGRLVAAAGNQPVLLDAPDTVWVVYSGHVEVFVVRVEGGQAVGPRRHLFQAVAGSLLCGVDLQGEQIGLLACGAPGTQLVRMQRSALARLGAMPEFAALVAALVESWIEGLSGGLIAELPPREFVVLEVGEQREVPAHGVVRIRGSVLWVTHEAGRSRYLGHAELPAVDGAAALPLSSRAWLQAVDAARLSAADTRSVLRGGAAWACLDCFHVLALAALAAAAERREQLEREGLAERAGHDRARLDAACARLAGVLAPRARGWAEVDGRDPLLAACQLVGNALGIAIKAPRAALGVTGRDDPLRAIAGASRVRTRRVALRGAWWNGESGPLLGHLEAERRPVALLPVAGGGYELHDPVRRTRQRVTAAVAATLGSFAETFYRPFDDGALSAGDLVRFGVRGCGRDLLRIALAGAAIALLGLLTPIATDQLFSLVIPGAQRSLLLQLGAGLVVAALATGLFALTRAFAVLRLSSKMAAATEPAVVDRLLDLPTTFFRDYTAGDLGQRALGLQVIREILSGAAVSTILSSLFATVSLVLLFVYDSRLALVACGLVLALVLALLATGALQAGYQRTLGELAGRVAGTTLQLINGVSKLRVAGAEERAFVFWAERFARQRRVTYQARTVGDALAVFIGAYPVLASLVLFAVVALALDPRPPIGTFLAFNAAFGQLVAAALAFGEVFTSLLVVVPTYERLRPILQTAPEVDAEQADPGELGGAIDVDRVSFRYDADGPLVLDDVSLRFRPGEFVALVGPSGSGKSTLLRLLLGFEAPAAGAILYDGRDLATLDVRAVRRQIGTVLQSGRLMTGDVFSNIVGASTLTLDDAWEAARMAGLDADIRAMPMGMNTVIGEGSSTLSGGQRQRLLIARAIVSRPRILFFDEATSALDNRTQEIVSRSLETLAATRVVIAHRLSTVVNADRIYVLQNGRVVESGTYRELMQRRGVFADLARRQIA